jgi:hypothetical protein
MKFMNKTAKYTRYDHKRNQDVIKELKTQSIMEKNYQNKWIQHVRRMDRSRLPNAIIKYQQERGTQDAH